MVDARNNEIRAGCIVAYPVRSGSKMWLNFLRVTQVEDFGDSVRVIGFSDGGRRVTIRNVHTCVVIENAPA